MQPYQQPGLVLSRASSPMPDIVRALQSDLRALGYLRGGIDGSFGPGTEAAVRALQFDLLHNQGASRGGDGPAPVAITDFNLSGHTLAVQEVNGIVDQALAGCLAALVADERIPQLPSSANPDDANARALNAIASSASAVAPGPFIAAIVRQESGGRHFLVPSSASADNYIVVGFDHATESTDEITSRGFGIGQYTLFHHPPRPDEVRDFMLDPLRNVQKAQGELRAKLDGFVLGPSDTADDRKAEHPLLPLRLCRYAPDDPKYMNDCRNCALAARKVSITTGTPWYAGCAQTYQPTQYYASANYTDVPDRADFLCDWPYAVRRYNGSGVNSFHYQTHVLLNLAALPAS